MPMLKCKDCPRCKDVYPGKLDLDGYHFCICGMSGNKIYPEPHKIKRASGSGYLTFGGGSCGIYNTVEDALKAMTESEIRRWQEGVNRYYGKIEEDRYE